MRDVYHKISELFLSEDDSNRAIAFPLMVANFSRDEIYEYVLTLFDLISFNSGESKELLSFVYANELPQNHIANVIYYAIKQQTKRLILRHKFHPIFLSAVEDVKELVIKYDGDLGISIDKFVNLERIQNNRNLNTTFLEAVYLNELYLYDIPEKSYGYFNPYDLHNVHLNTITIHCCEISDDLLNAVFTHPTVKVVSLKRSRFGKLPVLVADELKMLNIYDRCQSDFDIPLGIFQDNSKNRQIRIRDNKLGVINNIFDDVPQGIIDDGLLKRKQHTFYDISSNDRSRPY